MQEGDVQIKGYPVRLPLERRIGLQRQPRRLYGARKNCNAAQGSYWIGDPHALSDNAGGGHDHHRAGSRALAQRRAPIEIPQYVREVVEQVAFSCA